jgi:hypothetical protein
MSDLKDKLKQALESKILAQALAISIGKRFTIEFGNLFSKIKEFTDGSPLQYNLLPPMDYMLYGETLHLQGINVSFAGSFFQLIPEISSGGASPENTKFLLRFSATKVPPPFDRAPVIYFDATNNNWRLAEGVVATVQGPRLQGSEITLEQIETVIFEVFK